MLIDGITLAKQIENKIAHAVAKLKGRPPGLAFILLGDDPASHAYVRMKKKKCKEVGIFSLDKEMPVNTSQEQLIQEIQTLNQDPKIDGIIVQLPLPASISTSCVMQAIDPTKDVDGFHPVNMGKLLLGEQGGLIPCTPQAIHALLYSTQIPILGKHVVIIGRSSIVGKPLAALLIQKAPYCNATVTIAHSLSENLSQITQSADILVAAIGKPHYVKAEMVKKGAVVIDVGINRMIKPDGKQHIVGDVDFAQVAPLCSHITPVPGGVGPMTIAMLLSNTLLSYQTYSFLRGKIL